MKHVALFLLVLAVGAHAATGPAVIVERETAFARAVEEQGVKAGFLSVLAETAVVLLPEPTAARHYYEEKQEDGAHLRWRPDLAAMSAGGDFGWASGPWLAFAPGKTEASVAGHYLTVWRHSSDGWRVLLDGGISYPTASADRAHHLDVTPRLRDGGGSGKPVRDCDEMLAGRWKEYGRARALKDFGTEDLRLMQSGQPPLDGYKTALAGDNLRENSLRSQHVARHLAPPGADMLVSFGDYELYSLNASVPRKIGFVAVWDTHKECRLALELSQPLE
jgi:ketosteroid isomerase-like protein